jgi:hypothetical protein
MLKVLAIFSAASSEAVAVSATNSFLVWSFYHNRILKSNELIFGDRKKYQSQLCVYLMLFFPTVL